MASCRLRPRGSLPANFLLVALQGRDSTLEPMDSSCRPIRSDVQVVQFTACIQEQISVTGRLSEIYEVVQLPLTQPTISQIVAVEEDSHAR